MAAQDKDVKQATAAKPRPGWWRRNGRRLLVVVLLLMVAVAAGGYWMLIGRIRHLDEYQTAMQTIQSDKGVQQALGQPIEAVLWPPGARLEDRERDIHWEIKGPKSHAEAHVFAKKTGDKWEIKTLEVIPPGGKKILLDVKGDNEAPVFNDFPKPENKKSVEKGPGPDINMPVPPDMQGPGGK